MGNARAYKILIVAVLICATVLTMIVVNSLRFNPDPSRDQDFIARAQQKSVPGIKVKASALGGSESRRSFGENLGKYGIQPIWLEIENETDDQLVYLQIATDPDYYSPYEVSYRFHGIFSPAANLARDAFFLKRQIPSVVQPHSHSTGFVYGEADSGIKYARFVIVGSNRLETFDFALSVPGPAFVGTGVHADTIPRDQKVEDLDIDALRKVLTKISCCTTNSDTTRLGDPLNLVIVEGERDPIIPFIARDWHLAQKLDIASIVETARAFIFRDEYLTSPVSPLFVFNRREDVAIQKARSTINERIHARLWLTPYTFQSRRIWIGQVSRDIGVRLTDQTWNLTTHKIGPDVDFDRSYLLQDLLMSGLVERYGFVGGVGAATMSDPRRNLTGDPYYTDGLRLVAFLSNQTRTLGDIERLPWEQPPAPSDEAR